MAKAKKVETTATLKNTASKKKNIFVVSIILIVVGLIFFSAGSQILKVDKKNKFQQRRPLTESQKLDIIQNPEFKETWAIAIENRMEEQEKKVNALINEYSNKQTLFLDNMKMTLQEQNRQNQANIEALTGALNSKLSSMKQDVTRQFQAQEQKMRQLEIMASKGGGSGAGASAKRGDVVIGTDLMPTKPYSKKDEQPRVMLVVPFGGSNTVNKVSEKEKSGETAIPKKTDIPDFAVKIDENGTSEISQTTDIQGTIIKGPSEIVTEVIKGDDTNETAALPPIEEKPKRAKKVTTMLVDNSFNEKIIQAQNQIKQEIDKKEEIAAKDRSNFHLSTGLSQAFMITGAYAPAFQDGDSDPLPVLFEAEGSIIQPNDHLGSVNKCFLLGSAKGNMNSQTAEIKLVSISCLLDDGDYRIEAPISGWVIGENGIPGVQGELLHKNGAWLARTFIAGFLETFAKALDNTNTTNFNFGTDKDSMANNNQAFKNNVGSAAAGGFATVFQKLGDYYLKMAEQIFPVIEVRGGRTVDLLLMGGEDFTITDNSKMDLALIENFIDSKKQKEIQEQESGSHNPFTRSVMEEQNNKTDDPLGLGL